jgi:hypothetical protein
MKTKTPDGVEHELVEIDFKAPEEPWLEYKLTDGTLLKYRSTIMSVARSDHYDENGNPVYFVNSQQQWRTYSPPEIKGEPSKRIKVQNAAETPNVSYR